MEKNIHSCLPWHFPLIVQEFLLQVSQQKQHHSVNKIEEQIAIVQERHVKFVEKGNKSAEADVRKALGELKKLVTPYRKASVEATKGK